MQPRRTMYGLSHHNPDDAPPVEFYGKDFAMDEKTGAFSCALCMPVRRL